MSSASSVPDARSFMLRAIELARRGEGHVEPNPMVGAVLVRDGRIVGEGFHHALGTAHAEVVAIEDAGDRAAGGELYVTLEPCAHHGRTPPCVEAIRTAGVTAVHAAIRDPNPEVAGNGLARLADSGIAVDVGLCGDEVARLCSPYLKLVTTGRPWVIAKWAMSIDGKIATRRGDSRWISNSASRDRVHQIRGRVDAILVGIGTALADDPSLTARPEGPRTATRVVLDSSARLPLDGQLARTAKDIPVLLFTRHGTSPHQIDPLRDAGVEVCEMGGNTVNERLAEVLDELGRRKMTNLLVEGGSAILGSLADLDLIDEVRLFLAPLLLGGGEAISAVAGKGATSVTDGRQFDLDHHEIIDGDFYARYLRRQRGPCS